MTTDEREWRVARQRGAYIQSRACHCGAAVQVEVHPDNSFGAQNPTDDSVPHGGSHVEVFHFRKADMVTRFVDGFYPVTACPYGHGKLDGEWFEGSQPFPTNEVVHGRD